MSEEYPDLRISIKCPNLDCDSYSSRVIQRVESDDTTYSHIKRRRECLTCGTRFTTTEVYSDTLDSIRDTFIEFANKLIGRFDGSRQIVSIKKAKKR